MKFLYGIAEACLHELAGCADGGTAPAGHTLTDIGFESRQSLELISVKQVKIDSGTWDQTETEIYHLSRIKVL